MDINTATPTGYINVEDTTQVDLTSNQRWELHPDARISVDVYSDSGYITHTIELNADSTITEIILMDPTSQWYLIEATVDGQRYTDLQTNLDYDTQVRLITQ